MEILEAESSAEDSCPDQGERQRSRDMKRIRLSGILAVLVCFWLNACKDGNTEKPAGHADAGPAETTVEQPAETEPVEPEPERFVVTEPPAYLELDQEFYRKHVSADGYPVVGSAKVSDYALKEAAHLVTIMLSQRPDVKQAMIKGKSRLVVMAYTEFTTDVPEHSHMTPKPFRDRRARGLGGSQTDPVSSCAEENVLAFRGDPYAAENILIHEFAHAIHLRGMVNVDKTFDRRLKQVYDDAMKKGLWLGKYAGNNHHEYFAEGVQSWFNDNRENDHDHNHVNTRKELVEYDPGLAKMCEEVFGDTEFVYTKPATRLTGHLQGYDPATAPEFKWPKYIVDWNNAIREKRPRTKVSWTDLRRYPVSSGSKLRSGNSRRMVNLLIVNNRNRRIFYQWVDWKGKRPQRAVEVYKGQISEQRSFNTHVFEISDENRKPLFFVKAGETEGRILID